MYTIQVKPAGAEEWSARPLKPGIDAGDHEAVIGQAAEMQQYTLANAGFATYGDGTPGRPAEIRVVDADQEVIWPV